MDAIITIDSDQKIVVFNPSAEQMFGVSADEVLGEHISRFIPARYSRAHERHIEKFRRTGVTHRQMGLLGAISGRRADGTEFPLEASISQTRVDGEFLATVILRDITQRKASEDALSYSRTRMQGIVDAAMDAIITIDEDQKIILFNPAAEQMFGVNASQMAGQTIEPLLPARFRVQHAAHIQKFCRSGSTNRSMGALGKIYGLRSNGQEFPIEASISLIDLGGERLATVILRDITERVAGEEARMLLAREVDHRAKNVLAVAKSLVTLTKAPDKDAFVTAVTGRISALARAHALLSESRWQGAALERTINDELRAYVRAGQAHVAGPSVNLTADAVQPISMLIHELATNACKHGALTGEAGSIDIEWRILSDGSLHLNWRERGGEDIREPSTEGFGSELLKQVVTRQLKGAITMAWHSDGLEVALVLPPKTHTPGVDPAVRSPVEAEERAVRPASGPGLILVVEDEALLGMEIASELSSAGWKVIGPAASIEEAAKLISDTPTLTAALLDVNLQGRAVYPIADRLRKMGVPIIFCTGYELLDLDARFEDCRILRKPVPGATLRGELDRVIAA